MATLGELIVKITGDTGGLKSALSDAERGVGRLGASAASELGGRFAGQVKVATLAAVGLGVGVLGATAMAGFGFNSMRQQAQIAFETMLGSGQKAKAFLDELQAFAAKTPFEFPDLVQGAQRLLAMGFAAKDVLPTLSAIGDAVAGLGGGAETIDQVTRALGQMMAKGKVSAEEMMQLAEAGIPAWGMLAEKIGVSVPEAMKMAEKGAISANTAVGALVDGMNAKFGGMMEAQSHTFAGLLSTIKDTFGIISGQIMQPFFDMATRGMQKLVDITSTPEFTAGIERFAERITEATKAVEDWVKAHKDELVEALRVMAAGLQDLGNAAKDFGDWIISNQVRLVAAIGAIGVAFIWVNPLISLLIGVGGLAFALGAVGRSAEGLTGPLDDASRAAAGFRLEILKALKSLLEFLLTVETLGLSSIPGLGDKIQGFLASHGLSAVAEGLEKIDAEIASIQTGISAFDATHMVDELGRVVGTLGTMSVPLPMMTVAPAAEKAATIPGILGTISEEFMKLKARAEEAGPPVVNFGGGIGAAGGAAGAAAKEVLTLAKAISDGTISAAEAYTLGLSVQEVAAAELGAAAEQTALDVYRANVEIAKLGTAAGRTAYMNEAMKDSVIDLAEGHALGMSVQQRAMFELMAAEDQAAAAADRARVDLEKLRQVMGEQGLTADTLAFTVALNMAKEGTLTLQAGLDLGLTPSLLGAIQATADLTTKHQELQQAIYDAQVEISTFYAGLRELSGPAQDAVTDLYNIGLALGDEGLGQAALDYALAMDEATRATGEMASGALDFARTTATEFLSTLQGALSQLLSGPTVETAQLQLQINTAELEKAIAVLAGASEEQTQAYDDTIAALRKQLDVYEKEHAVLQAKATLADQTLPTERELKDMAADLTDKIKTQSAVVVELVKSSWLQADAVHRATTESGRLADVAKGFADYQFWLAGRIGDAAEKEIIAHWNVASAAQHAADVLNALHAPEGYQAGLPYVPQTMIAQVHPQEAILTAAQAREWRSGRSGGSTGPTIINRQNFGRQQFIFPQVDPRKALREADMVLRGL